MLYVFFVYRKWSYAIGGNMVTRKQEKISRIPVVDTVGIKSYWMRLSIMSSVIKT